MYLLQLAQCYFHSFHLYSWCLHSVKLKNLSRLLMFQFLSVTVPFPLFVLRRDQSCTTFPHYYESLLNDGFSLGQRGLRRMFNRKYVYISEPYEKIFRHLGFHRWLEILICFLHTSPSMLALINLCHLALNQYTLTGAFF